MSKPTFERTADATLEQVRAIYSARGQEYADSWALENLVTTYLDSTLAMMGLTNVPAEVKRLLQLACLVDVKDSRMGGPWKSDSAIDGIAYRASYTALREEYEKKPPSA
jgi:hypothetical protein